MSMKRTIPGGRVESIYTQSQNGKQVIATTINQAEVETEEVVEVVEAEQTEPQVEEAQSEDE